MKLNCRSGSVVRSRIGKALAVSVVSICLLMAATLAFSQEQSASAPEQGGASRAQAAIASMPDSTRFQQVEISPDGKTVACIMRGSIYLRHLENGNSKSAPNRIFIPGQHGVRDFAWSPDSRQLVFLADTGTGAPAAQVWVADIATASPHKLAELRGYVSNPSFSPDGKSIAVLFVENMPRVAGPLVPMTPVEGVVEEHVYEQRLATIDLASQKVRQVSPSDVYVYEYDWAPDSKSWVVSAARGSGDNNWWVARLYTVNAETGTMHEIVKPKLQIAVPRFSPDGKAIAYISGIMSDEGSTGGDIFVVPAEGGEPRNVTEGMKASATWLTWTSPGQILFTENVDGNSGIAKVSAQGGDIHQLWKGFEMLSADGWGIQISLARDGVTSAVVRQSFNMPPEIWAGPIGNWAKITSANAGAQPAWGEARNVHWKNGDLDIQGWLLFPRDYDQGQKHKYPLVVTVHGGPAAACMPRWDTANGAASALGYFVLCPNPRGSFGQGEAFTQANVKDFGGGDFRDIMAGIDAMAKEFPVDPNRLGIHGHSYGGYMTMWAETQTNRFKAAVAGAGLSNWLSYYGENDIDEWMIPFFGASVYDDPAVYAKSSPINFVKNVKTPTLILVGDRDGEVPAPQSFEWWHALKTLGVPVQFVVYPNEGHAISQPQHRYDYQLRTLEWFDKWFKAAESSKSFKQMGSQEQK